MSTSENPFRDSNETARAPGTPGLLGWAVSAVRLRVVLSGRRGVDVSLSKIPGVPGVLAVLSLWLVAGCVTVRPEKRSVLADPIMQFHGDAREAAQRQHVVENREGSFGGSSVKGGGCGCN